MVTGITYMAQNLKPGTEVHPALKDYFLTQESTDSIQELLDNVTATDTCIIPSWESTCWVSHTTDEAKTRMAQLLIQMDSKLNPHRFISTVGSNIHNVTHVLDPRVRDIVYNFLPTLSRGECYSYSEIESSATLFTNVAQQSGLELFAQTSPCHTTDPKSLTCTWSNFPGSVDEGVWLDAGQTIHPRLTNIFFTKRAAAGLREIMKKADAEAQPKLADLILIIDQTFNPYDVQGRRMVIDGSVRALELLIAQNQPPFDRINTAYASAITEMFDRKWAGYFPANSVRHYQMMCESQPLMDNPLTSTTDRITCSYVTTAADVD